MSSLVEITDAESCAIAAEAADAVDELEQLPGCRPSLSHPTQECQYDGQFE